MLLQRAVDRDDYPQADLDALAQVAPMMCLARAVAQEPISRGFSLRLIDDVILPAMRGSHSEPRARGLGTCVRDARRPVRCDLDLRHRPELLIPHQTGRGTGNTASGADVGSRTHSWSRTGGSMTVPVRVVTDAERRARLGVRHALAREATCASGDVLAVTRAVVCLHATEPASVHLSAWARSGATRTDVEDALYRERSIVKQLAMRRTVFAVPVDLLPAIRGSAAARVAAQQGALLARSVVAGGLAPDGEAWVEQACSQMLAELRLAPATTRQLREQLPVLTARLPRPETPAAPPSPVASRVLTVLAAAGQVVRGDNTGSWTTSRPVWTPVEDWVPDTPQPLSEVEGYAELVCRWLWAYGPGTEADLVWWLGATKAAVRRALADVGAVAVQLEDGSPAWLHPDDVEQVHAPQPWAALLPALDPTTMGWRGRAFHLDPATADVLYDRAGNGLPTAWWNGHIVGGWAQRSDGTVLVLPQIDLPLTATDALKRKAAELTEWLGGQVLRTTFYRPTEESSDSDLPHPAVQTVEQPPKAARRAWNENGPPWCGQNG
jgi:hypothetical protein